MHAGAVAPRPEQPQQYRSRKKVDLFHFLHLRCSHQTAEEVFGSKKGLQFRGRPAVNKVTAGCT